MAASVSSRLRITIVTPAERGSRGGNRTTALRWCGLLRQLGHRTRIVTEWRDHEVDVLVVVHAVKSADAMHAAVATRPNLPVVLLLAGTDIYPDFAPGEAAQRCLDRANALVALQPRALELLPAALQQKARTIVQSATATPAPRAERFTAVVLAHLRAVKHPRLAIDAVAQLPSSCEIELSIAGSKLDADYAADFERALRATPRARYLGEVTRAESKRLLAASHVCIVPSRSEGGANVVSEAIAANTPVLCTDVPGNTGLLGDDWPATFPVDDAPALAALLQRASEDRAFLQELQRRTTALQPMVSPDHEREAWRNLLIDLQSAR